MDRTAEKKRGGPAVLGVGEVRKGSGYFEDGLEEARTNGCPESESLRKTTRGRRGRRAEKKAKPNGISTRGGVVKLGGKV